MAFDLLGARSAGYSDDDIADSLAGKFNFDIKSARASGYKPEEIITHLVSRAEQRGSEIDKAARRKRTLDDPLFDDAEVGSAGDGGIIDTAKRTYLGASVKSGVESLAGTVAKIVDPTSLFTLSEADAAAIY